MLRRRRGHEAAFWGEGCGRQSDAGAVNLLFEVRSQCLPNVPDAPVPGRGRCTHLAPSGARRKGRGRVALRRIANGSRGPLAASHRTLRCSRPRPSGTCHAGRVQPRDWRAPAQPRVLPLALHLPAHHRVAAQGRPHGSHDGASCASCGGRARLLGCPLPKAVGNHAHCPALRTPAVAVAPPLSFPCLAQPRARVRRRACW